MTGITHRSRIVLGASRTLAGATLALSLSCAACDGDIRRSDRTPPAGGGEDTATGAPTGGRETTGRDDARGDDARAQARCPADAPQPVNRVRIHPAPGKAATLVGARIQGSNTSPTNDFVDLATIEAAPREGAFTELEFGNTRLFRYVKLYAPDGGAVAELALYHDRTELEGTPFGTAGADFARAFDGDPSTVFEGTTEGGSYVGLDVAGDAVAREPTFTPPPGNFGEAPQVEIVSPTPDVRIRYTLDGSNPTRDTGTLYEGGFTPEGRASIKAVAYADCLFDSPVASARYGVGSLAVTRGFKSYHLGNSLTDTINAWLEPIADSTGVDHQYARWTIPGAPVKWLAEHHGQGFGTPEGAQNIDTFAGSFAPIDHISLQPFSSPSLKEEGGAAVQLLGPVLASSPEVQVWIYAQWPEQDTWAMSALATGAGWADPPWTPAKQPTNWEEATLNQQDYHEAFAAYVDERIPGKSVKVVPAGRGLVRLKQAIERGQVPGIRDFFGQHFSDELHLSTKGQYLVGLVFYASLYGQSPEGIVTHAGTELTEAQARIYQRIAWDAVNE